VAERILATLKNSFEIESQHFVVTGSIGIALSGTDGDDVDALLRNADTAMYRAKQENRGTYRFYDRSMNALVEENLSLESDLRAAIDADQIDLHFQPKVELASGRLTGFEALARWNHPARGLVPPDRFIPVAEAAGLMIALGERVLRKACLQVKEWRRLELPPVRISVNISAHQFATDAIGEMVQAVLRETPVSPRQLDIEITESAMMLNKDVTENVLRMLKGFGITVAIDDFGTGYSSLSYLKGFPVDSIKIDRAFVRDITEDPDDAALTAAIISMAKALNLRIVAEGVETEEQLAFLRERGCDEAQGYLFSKPLPAEAATEFLRARSGNGEAPKPESV
ncbi:MAG: EAL domain-containing protein, partial [Myxococcales bacterium]|nr:EAL domain-containing protein [Myxococcales bacterium]